MKHSLLFSAAILAASSAWAAAPTSVILSGDALADSESGPVECTKISDGNFQAFVELKAGQPLTVKGGDGTVYTFNNAQSNLNGVYKIDLNFTGDNPTLNLKQIKHLMMKHCWTGTNFILDYVGDGAWAGSFNWSTLGNQDDRYQIAMRYPRDDDNFHKWGPVNTGNDAKPDGTAEYFHLKEAPNATQWDPKWKIDDKYKDGKSHLVIVTMRGTYTHSFAEIGEIPASLTVTGSALTEGTSFNLNKIDDNTFELFTKLKEGNLKFNAGNTEYTIAKGKIAAGADAVSVAKDGVYCINVNFASGAASVKEVSSLKYYHLTSFGPKGESLEYKGNGVWSGNVDIPTNDDRYRLEMYIDGDIQQWGAKNATGKKPSEANIGDSYFEIKRVPWTFWNNEFKNESSLMGTNTPLTVKFDSPSYTHSFSAYVATGIEDITVDENAPVEYYNLQGVRVENPANGLYIRRQGNKATKVLVK
ncbi:MAG: hypothetical protein K2I39_09360 [Muribaculaceae bacterium]|nr:hypothetical protein [Muribaculaceae bacterium]